MPKVTLNPSVDHLHGHVGRMIYKTWKGKNIEQAKPESVNQPDSPAQLAVRQNFSEATHWAKGVFTDATVNAAYTAKAD